jgi:tetratricopeptide (TPR) repeat protein
MLLVGAATYDLNFGKTGKRLNHHLYETLMMRNCDQIVDAYEKMLAENPDSPEILNNLAWIFATSDKPECQNRKRALVLAEKAIVLKREAHILDTLAEAYYVNGLFQEAIATEKQALAMAPEDDRDLYEKQLVKFKKAYSQSSD